MAESVETNPASEGTKTGSYLRRILDSWPALLMALAYYMVGVLDTPLPGYAKPLLVKTLKMEPLVIHVGIFLTLFPLFGAGGGPGRTRIWYFFNIAKWGFVALYLYIAHDLAGWEGVFILLPATAATYWGALREWSHPQRLFSLLVRWAFVAVVFILCINLTHLPNNVADWNGSRPLYLCGFLYFLCLGLLEWSGLFRASFWEKVGRGQTSKKPFEVVEPMFQKTNLDDFEEILKLLQRISSWLAGKGIDQWRHFFNEKGKATLERRFREGEVFKVLVNGNLLGVFVIQWDDAFWHPEKKDGLAGYIHTMGIDPTIMGIGIGKKILSFVENIAAGAGRKYVRLDCNGDNARLCEYYESNGFYKAGSKPWENWNVRLYEKKL